jgi:hypothetical protein
MLDLVATLGGLVVPPLFSFLKDKFGSKATSPEETLGTLATVKPEILPTYVDAESRLLDAQVKFFNRDVVGAPSLWVVNLRAAIRPIFVAVSVVAILSDIFFYVQIDPSLKQFMEAVISSWFGDRIFRK